MLYKMLRKVLFSFPPEDVHYFSMNALRIVCKAGLVHDAIAKQFSYASPALAKNIIGLQFINPVGLGAGFDKNALYLHELETLGFGFAEIGTVTPKPQSGNEKPRLFRLSADGALINRMGFNNDGVSVVRERLEKRRQSGKTTKMIIGGNIGKNKVTDNEDAWKDYVICFNELFGLVDYFTVNVSSPNTPGLRALQEKDALKKIFSELQQINAGKQKRVPILLKISPDLNQSQLDDIVSLAFEINLDGLVISNTTIGREHLKTNADAIAKKGAGGLSGKPLMQLSTEVLQYISKQTAGKIPLIASGGIFTGEDAKKKMDAGASLIQVWTGFIYEGPSIVKNICMALDK